MLCVFLFYALATSAPATPAPSAKVIKTLAQFLDARGRSAVSPSLYERDAYQVYLRKRPKEQAGICLKVQWKAAGVDWSKMKLRAELRGVKGDTLNTRVLEMPVKKSGLFSAWSEFKLEGVDFRQFGELAAWRITLWQGEEQLAEQESFMWSGVRPNSP